MSLSARHWLKSQAQTPHPRGSSFPSPRTPGGPASNPPKTPVPSAPVPALNCGLRSCSAASGVTPTHSLPSPCLRLCPLELIWLCRASRGFPGPGQAAPAPRAAVSPRVSRPCCGPAARPSHPRTVGSSCPRPRASSPPSGHSRRPVTHTALRSQAVRAKRCSFLGVGTGIVVKAAVPKATLESSKRAAVICTFPPPRDAARLVPRTAVGSRHSPEQPETEPWAPRRTPGLPPGGDPAPPRADSGWGRQTRCCQHPTPRGAPQGDTPRSQGACGVHAPHVWAAAPHSSGVPPCGSQTKRD